MDQNNQENKISPLPIISPLQTKQLDEQKVKVAKLPREEKTTE